MKKNYFFSLWLRAFSCTTTMTMLFTALMALMTNTTKTFAENNSGTTYKVPNGISELVGIDPSDDYLSRTQTNMPTGDKVDKLLYIYNVGAKRFLSPGGKWGTQASLDNSPYPLWLNEPSGDSDEFNIVNNLSDNASTRFLGKGGKSYDAQDLFMDSKRHNFVFEKAPDYTENNKVYYLKMTDCDNTSIKYYIQANPDENPNKHTLNTTQLTKDNADYKYQEWKIITRNEYYELVKANPANMEDVIDFSFIINAADFRVNNKQALSWQVKEKATDKASDKIFFGDNLQYKTFANRDKTDKVDWTTYYENHQYNYGKLFYSYARGAKNFEFYQDIQVHKAGWYLLRCNGFTTQVNDKGRVSARLMMAVVKNGSIDKTGVYSAATLNKLSPDKATELMGKDKDGTGAGRAFFDGEYENQVQVCLDDKNWVTKISETNPVTLRIGYYVGDDCVLHDGDVTCVDNFKLLYAGPRRDPELILDEDQTDLMYLTNAKDTYKNSVLHLNRTFKEGQWNSLILPVNLKFGQMKRTFGDDVKVAKLTSLENGVVTFRTVEPQQDSDVMVTAFEPYIVKPTVLTDDKGLAYTAEKFYTRRTTDDKGEDVANNAYWLAADGKSESSSQNDKGCLSLTIAANHYDITMVTLDRAALVKHLNLSETDQAYYDKEEYDKINWNNVSWISQTSFSTGATDGDLTCYGTLTKTYDDKEGIISGRDNLSGDYVMRGGKIVQVPSDKEFGLKGFRCWFEVKGSHPGIAAAPRLEIDGIIDDATAIDDLNSQPSLFTSRHKGISGVFNLDGQKVRDGESTQDLPKGIYIVNGRKVVVR